MKMDVGIERKFLKGKPGIHVHYYTSLNPRTITFTPREITVPITIEELCIRIFKHEQFCFTEKDFPFMERDPGKIYPASMHLFQLWDCDSQQWQAPNHELRPSEFNENSKEYVLRIRFKYPPSLEKLNFSEVWDTGDFYYYFAQCRHDFIHDILHDTYHSHMKEDVCIGLAIVDMARVAFEKGLQLKQLKAKYDYHDFLPRHISKRTKNLLVKLKLSKSSDSALEETFNNFYIADKNPHKISIISYLQQVLSSAPDYTSEEFQVQNPAGRCVVHPYREKQRGILYYDPKGNLEYLGDIGELTAIDTLCQTTVLLHFTNAKSRHLEFVNGEWAAAFVSLLDGYYRLMYDYHYCLSNHVFSPIVKLWNDLKCYGPLSIQHHCQHYPGDTIHKDYLKTIWKRNSTSIVEGTFLIKQRSTSFEDFVIIYHKMGRNLPALPVIYDAVEKRYKLEEETVRLIVQNKYTPLSFSSMRELVRYYRSGDCKSLRLTNQLSPIPKEEVPLMICRERVLHKKDSSQNLPMELDKIDKPIILTLQDVHIGRRLHESHCFDIMEGTFGREQVVIKQLKENATNRDVLTLFFQKDVQKFCNWRHDCIVQTYGVCLSPFYVMSQKVLEGRLDHLFKRRHDSFKIHHCVQVTGQLAQAVMYLESHGFTHGGIRAKTILVSHFDSHGGIDVKLVADMRTSYMASLPLNDRHNIERLPWIALERWTNLHNETSESDVYSFGVTVWEIFSLGERPFTSCATLEEVKSFIESGRSLPVPKMIASMNPLSKLSGESNLQDQYDALIDVLYKKIILDNISEDPACRMKPQDTVREMILLNSKFTANQYDPLLAVTSPSYVNGSHVQTTSSSHSLSDKSVSSSTGSQSGRPLPAPPSSNTQYPHVIRKDQIVGLEGNTVVLGQGFYGQVYLCKLLQNGQRPKQCAVKKLINKDRTAEAFERGLAEFERELKLMVSLEHENIVKLYGECFYHYPDGKESRLIVMEYVKCGSLAIFVRNKTNTMPFNERITLYKKFALDVAEGMRFLHDEPGIIHRDLAARNVLVTEKPHTAKITDFGLARTLGEKDYYRCDQQSVLPCLWCAPESLSGRKFTKASDVWSYAVLLWEMYSGGERPIISSVKNVVRGDGSTEVDINNFIEILNSSGPNTRLPKPPDLSTDMYNLMTRCWLTEPSKRPTFAYIKTELENQVPL